mmetsp:Transcript_6074/g.20346  ORF Transcript_6074/g.20346 Transcript_6074/m.20346 type:complete len:392 (+) Transcript_6074:457-1632(+)
MAATSARFKTFPVLPLILVLVLLSLFLLENESPLLSSASSSYSLENANSAMDSAISILRPAIRLAYPGPPFLTAFNTASGHHSAYFSIINTLSKMTRCNFSSAVSGNPSSPFSVGEGDDNISRFTFSSISSTHCSNNFNSGGTSSPSPIIASTTAGLIPRALALRSKFFRVKPFARSKFFIFKLSRKSFLCSVNFFSRSANAFSSSSSSSSYSRIRGRRRRGGKGVRGTREEIYAAEKTLSREFEDEEFRTREWFHAEEFGSERERSRDESRGRGCDDGRRRRCPAGVEVVGTMRGRYGRKGETGDVVVAFANRERRRRISRDGGGEVTTRHLRESVYDRKIRRVVARSGVESGQKRRSRIRQTNGGTKDGNRRVHRGIRVFERVRRRSRR